MVAAVVFDLFHTLIGTEHLRPDGFDYRDHIVRLTGVDRQDFAAFWKATYRERETTPVDLVELFERFALAADVQITEEERTEIDRLFGVAKDEAVLNPRPEMLELLAHLASQRPLGVLSNCHERETRQLEKSPIAKLVSATVRSCDIGCMKPEPESYAAILDALNVDAGDSLYVGNGGSGELRGARDVGFRWVLHCNIFDIGNGLVSPAEQQRRAGQAHASVETVEAMGWAIQAQLDAAILDT